MHGIYDNDKAGKWKVIKDMTVIGAMRNPAEGKKCCLSSRLAMELSMYQLKSVFHVMFLKSFLFVLCMVLAAEQEIFHDK